MSNHSTPNAAPEGEPSVTLQTAELPIISTEECALTYGDRVNPIQNICAGSSEKDSTDTCKVYI